MQSSFDHSLVLEQPTLDVADAFDVPMPRPPLVMQSSVLTGTGVCAAHAFGVAAQCKWTAEPVWRIGC